MFSRDEFMSYVGSASGSSYAAGLKASIKEYITIEKQISRM